MEFNDVALTSCKPVIDAIIAQLHHTKIIIFEGEMGSGKTTLIKELCAQLQVADIVNSPTYSIVNEYLTLKKETVYHFDFFRLNSIEEAIDLGSEDYFYSGNICLIEWANLVMDLLPKDKIKVSISKNKDTRNYSLEVIHD